MSEYLKPLPEADEASRPFWDGAMDGRLVLMKCTACGTWRLPSRGHCDNCLSDQFTWETASGRGTVRTFGVMWQKYQAGWAAETPYNVTIVELEEGVTMFSSVIECAPGELHIGMSLQVVFEAVSPEMTLPKFRPA